MDQMDPQVLAEGKKSMVCKMFSRKFMELKKNTETKAYCTTMHEVYYWYDIWHPKDPLLQVYSMQTLRLF